MTVPNVAVTYAQMQRAAQRLQAIEAEVEGFQETGTQLAASLRQ